MDSLIAFQEVLPDEINCQIVEDLAKMDGWRIAFDLHHRERHVNIITDPTVDGVLTGEQPHSSDAGHILSTFHLEEGVKDYPGYDKMNVYAEMILNVCLQRAKKAGYFYKDASLVRVFWNYYSSSSFGSMHTDCGPPESSNFDRPCWSLVYYLNTCEGCGTRVIDTINGGMMETYPSIAGNAILFPSHTLHGGTGAPKMGQRFCVNVMFEAELIKKEEE